MPLGTYIKSHLFADGAPPKLARTRRPVREHRALAQVLARLGASRMANNLNQLAHAANSGSLDCDEGTIALIAAAQSDLAIMRELLMRALGLQSSPPSPPHAEQTVLRPFTLAAAGESET
jgi:Bacterial mobilisation protein (MobC)